MKFCLLCHDSDQPGHAEVEDDRGHAEQDHDHDQSGLDLVGRNLRIRDGLPKSEVEREYLQ